jgi:hypothetical protein
MNETYRILEELGPLPDASEAIADGILEKYEELFESIAPPQGIEEAIILAQLFPKSSCFGLEWTILHLLEKTPNWPLYKVIESCLSDEWKSVLLERLG